MKLFKWLTNKGFSLPEVMVGVGLLGGVSLVTMKLVQEQTGNQKVVKANAEVSKAVSMIQQILSNDVACSQSLRGLNLSSGSANVPSIRMIRPTDNQSVVYLEVPKDYGDFQLINPSDLQLVKTGAAADGTGMTDAELRMTFWIRKKDAVGNKTTDAGLDNSIKKAIKMQLKLDAAGSVQNCGAVASDASDLARQKFCESMAGAAQWDASLKKCKLKSMDCPWGKIPKGMTSLGSVICVDIESTMNEQSLNEIVQPGSCNTASGQFTLCASAGGKMYLKCGSTTCP